MSNQKNLTDTALTALKWNYGGMIARAGSSLAVSIILARLLGPEPFGLVAIALLIIRLGNLIADLGMGSALVQRETISEHDVRYAFTIQICLGIGLMVMVALSAPVIAHLFNQPNLVPVVRVLSLIFVIQALGQTAAALLRRDMDFKRLQVSQINSYLIGFLALGIPLAFLGLEVWSLVIAQLAQTILFTAFCYLKIQHRIKPLFVSKPNNLFQFGYMVILTNIANWAINNMDSFFIGYSFDTTVLGFYNRVYNLVTTPINNIVTTLQHVMFPLYSRTHHDLQKARQVYLACVECLTTLMLPAYGCLAVVPATVIHGLFGDEWAKATPLVTPLALAMLFRALMATGGPMLWAQNRVGREFRAQLYTALVLLLVLFITSRFSVIILAWGILGVSILRFFLVTHMSLQTLGISWSRFVYAMSGGLVLLFPTGGIVFFSDHAIASLTSSFSLRLVFDVTVGTGVLSGTTLIAPKLVFSPELCKFVNHMTDQLPIPIRPLMRKIFA